MKHLEIKIASVVAICVLLNEADPKKIDTALRNATGGSADFFENDFCILDVGRLAPAAAPQWKAITAVLQKHRLRAVAVRQAPAEWTQEILAAGLLIDNSDTTRGRDPAPAGGDAAVVQQGACLAAVPGNEPGAAGVYAPPMVIDSPVRAGQRVYARGGDLIVTAVVNNGAEIIADGNIHVYAPLRGRALAGASQNTQARIFASMMEAELVSIAGIYRTFDRGFPAGIKKHGCQVRLDGEKIELTNLAATQKV